MIADARHRVGYLYLLQRRAVQERDVADLLDTAAPVDRLKRRAVVEQAVSRGTPKRRVVVGVIVLATELRAVLNSGQHL